MPAQLDIQVDDRNVRRFLRLLERRVSDLRPAMRGIAGILHDEVEQAFSRERDPATGQAWAPLSPVTLERRRKRRKVGKKLQVTGALARSIDQQHGRDFAAAGTNLEYARTHQFGARKGAFGRTRRGAPIPWGDIPARPFLGLSTRGQRKILNLLRRHIRRATR